MPSATKNVKKKGSAVSAASGSRASNARAATSKASAAKALSGKKVETKPAAARSAAKTARTSETTRAEASVTKTGKTSAAKVVSGSSAAKGPVKADAAKASVKKTAAPATAAKNLAAKSATAKSAAPALDKAAAKIVKKVATAAPAKATATPAKPAATPAKAAETTKAKTAGVQTAKAASAVAPKKSEAVRPAAAIPAPPAATAREVKAPVSPPSGVTAATSGPISSTKTGEEKKLAKRDEPPVAMATPVASEKSVTESKMTPKTAPAKPKPATAARHGFKLNEFIVYPAHGVGQIVGMETQEVAGFSLELFVVSFIKDKMILKVPTSKVSNVGMRKLAETGVVEKALSTLSGRARVKRTMWSRRAQEYEAKINSGDLVTIAEVVRDLYRSDTQPEQSYSERQLYEAALDRMAREVAAVRKLIDSEALKLIESFLQKGPRRGQKTDADVANDGDEEDVEAAA